MNVFQSCRGLEYRSRLAVALHRALTFTLLAGFGIAGCMPSVEVPVNPTGVVQLALIPDADIDLTDTVVLTVYRVEDGALGDEVLRRGGLATALFNAQTETFDIGEHLAHVELIRAGTVIGTGEATFFVGDEDQAASPEVVHLAIQFSVIVLDPQDEKEEVKEPATGVAQIAIEANAGIQPTDTAVLTVHRVNDGALCEEVLHVSDVATALYTAETETCSIGEYVAHVDLIRDQEVIGTGEIIFHVGPEDQATSPESVLIPIQISTILVDPKDEKGGAQEKPSGASND